MKKYTQLHFFLDESGNLAKPRRNEALLVGGILIFGRYEKEDDAFLKNELRTNSERLGIKFPQGLHFSQRSSDGQMQELMKSMSLSIKEWTGTERAVYGIHIVHDQDIFTLSSGLLAERERDNRYLSMLWSLIEHLVFVDEKVAERLEPAATIHLHIATRLFKFDPGKIDPEEIRSLGLQVKNDEKGTGKKVVTCIVNEREIVAMIRMAQRQRWSHSTTDLGQVELKSIQYDPKKCAETPAGLYLADIYLGPVRQQHRPSNRKKLKSSLVPTFRELRYGRWLESLAEMQAALSRSDLSSYLQHNRELHGEAANWDPSPYAAILKRQERSAGRLLRSDHHQILKLAEDAATTVDQPGMARAGFSLAEQAQRLMQLSGTKSLHAEALICQTRLSHANHVGDGIGAREAWDEYLSLEPELHTLGPTGLNLMAAIRNRHAVSLTDQFMYDKAKAVLSKVVSDREVLRKSLAELFGVDTSNLPSRQLAECLGSLGQVHAFEGTNEGRTSAEACFRQAADLFVDQNDVDRQYIYLGHLACDAPEQSEALWTDVTARIPQLQKNVPSFQSGEQFKFALWLKGLLVFGSPDRVAEFAGTFDSQTALEGFTAVESQHHPFGLVHQCLGLIYCKDWRHTGSDNSANRATEHFREAVQAMQNGGSLLKLLAYMAHLRLSLFRLECNPGAANQRKRLCSLVRSIIGHLSEHFSPGGWEEDDETGHTSGWFGSLDTGEGSLMKKRASSLLSGIRFNYW